MVISSSSSLVVNMKFMIYKMFMLSLSILVLQSSTAWSRELGNQVKSVTLLSPKLELGPGMIANKDFWDVKFPKGHIGVKSFDAELVDEEGRSVPLHETYLHHFFAVRYWENITYSQNPHANRTVNDGRRFERNDGLCEGSLLPHHWGFGGETRGTSSNIPDPFALQLGIPDNGWEEKWMLNVMAIDTRGVQDREGCTQCRCDLFNVTKNYLETVKGIDGKILTTAYKGGIFCCKDNTQCKLQENFQGSKRNLFLKYTIKYVDWDQHQVPVKFYILDVVDRVTYNGSQTVHQCLVEYSIPKNDGSDSPYDIKKAKIPMKKGGNLIYGTAHVHSGIVNATLYGQDGRVLCAATPKYGTGKEPGNEEGYVVGMSVCYPKPGSVKIDDGETLTVEFVYKSGYRTGVMGHFYIHLAEQLPHSL